MENAPVGWHAVPARELLAAATGLPVYVDSHARALARSSATEHQTAMAG